MDRKKLVTVIILILIPAPIVAGFVLWQIAGAVIEGISAALE